MPEILGAGPGKENTGLWAAHNRRCKASAGVPRTSVPSATTRGL